MRCVLARKEAETLRDGRDDEMRRAGTTRVVTEKWEAWMDQRETGRDMYIVQERQDRTWMVRAIWEVAVRRPALD